MLAINYTTLRDNMKKYFDKISDTCETMIVTRKDENMVIMSQSTYDSLMETVYLLENPANLSHLMKSVEQHKTGKMTIHNLAEESND